VPEIGKEPNQEPVQLTPIPAYEYPLMPGQRPTPGTPLSERTVPEMPERSAVNPEREKVPVSYSPTRSRSQPFLPVRRGPEYFPIPVQPGAEIIQDPVQLPPQKRIHEPPYQQNPVKPPVKLEQPPENFNQKFNPVQISDEISGPKVEQEQQSKVEQKPGNSVQPTKPLQPRFTTKLYGKQNRAGRQRGKDRTDSTDGVRQLFELWWSKAGRGVAFQLFYQNHLSKSMRFYYPREYIHGANTKSAAEYRQWRKEWTAKHAVKTA
jgi:hypothetical protein